MLSRSRKFCVFGVLILLWYSGGWAQAKDGEKKILIFGDPNPHNPQWQKDLMERSLQQVAKAFKANSFEIDLIPTTEVSPEIIKERLARYAGSLSTNDTFVMYSHSHGTRKGTYFSSWPDLAESILAIPARNVVILTMSCASGNLTDTFLSMKSKWEGRSRQGRSHASRRRTESRSLARARHRQSVYLRSRDRSARRSRRHLRNAEEPSGRDAGTRGLCPQDHPREKPMAEPKTAIRRRVSGRGSIPFAACCCRRRQ